MNEKPEKNSVIKNYLTKFPNTGKKALSRKIYKETYPLFDSAEQARGLIRLYTGSSGKKSRSQLGDRRFMRDETVKSENKYDLPETDALEYPVFKFPKAQNRILVAGDFHIPYHDVSAITAMIDWAKDHDINTVLLNGDIIDFYQLSTFVKDPRKRRFKDERDMFWRTMDVLQNQLPGAVFYFKTGNHEERYENYLKIKAPELFDTEEYQLDIILKLGERGMIFIGDKIRIEAGKLGVYHGHELGRGGGGSLINVSRWVYMRTGESTMANHFHKTSEFVQTTASGDILSCFSVGVMCDLHPEYLPNNNWNAGFARVLVQPNDDFKVTNLKVYEGKVL